MEQQFPEEMRLPSDFRSDRTIARAANRHCTAHTVIGSGPGVRMQAESHLELVSLLVLNAKLEIEDIFDQVRFSWKNAYGKLRSHVFDYVAQVRGGAKIAYAVKPFFRAMKPGFLAEMQEVAWFGIKAGFCSDVRILTERCADRIEKRNAQLFWATRVPEPIADEAALQVASNLLGAASIQDLTFQTGQGAAGFQALIRLVATQQLVPVTRDIITHKSLVQRKG